MLSRTFSLRFCSTRRLTGVALAPWLLATAIGAAAPPACQRVTPELRERCGLDEFYSKAIDDRGIVFVGSEQVSDVALTEACILIDRMLAGNAGLRRELADAKLRVAVMAPTEMTTDLPEHRRLRPQRYWDRRARGLGASRRSPVVSCGEENLLGLEGDPYAGECILLHEFAHAVDELGMAHDPQFKVRLQAAYDRAVEAGLWRGAYAATDPREYWAEGAQSWFHCNAAPNKQHIDVQTREQLASYDPPLAALLAEVFGDTPWRYEPPAKRLSEPHLASWRQLPPRRFEWPAELRTIDDEEIESLREEK